MLGKNIIVNYHYVRDPDPKERGIHPCSLEEFEREVAYLARNYKIVSVGEVFASARQKGDGRFCAITFDDGLKDHYYNALPVLKKYGAAGTFFPSPSTFDGQLPATHKIHLILSRFPVMEVIDVFNKFTKTGIPTNRRLFNRRLHEDIPTANFKETMITLSRDEKDRFLNRYFAELDLDEKKIAQEIFMTKAEIKSLRQEGMTVGSHSHGHYSMAAVGKEFIRQDIRQASQSLFEVLGEKVSVFSYPHGHSTPESVKVLKEEGFEYAVTIEPREVKSGDKPLLLPRYDTIHLKTLLNSG